MRWTDDDYVVYMLIFFFVSGWQSHVLYVAGRASSIFQTCDNSRRRTTNIRREAITHQHATRTA
jgi:hypothetical protein